MCLNLLCQFYMLCHLRIAARINLFTSHIMSILEIFCSFSENTHVQVKNAHVHQCVKLFLLIPLPPAIQCEKKITPFSFHYGHVIWEQT